MTAAPASVERRVDLRDAFAERAAARAYLWSVGEYELREAIDVLQHDAERDGLIDRIGQDAVQAILAQAFQPYREADMSDEWGNVEITPADIARAARWERDYPARQSGKADKASENDPRENIPPAESLDDGISSTAEPVDEAPPASSKEIPPLVSKKQRVAFPLRAFENVTLENDQRGYLVKGLLPSRGLAVIWGPPKCGKSFWATDIGLHIALGWQYRGGRVQQATVVYIALEGRHGLPARLEAFRHHHDVQSAPFYLLTTPLDLAAKADALIASIEAQLGKTKPGAIFIDTLNRSLVGSESKDEDMARYLAAAGKIEEKFGCLVAIVHHCGIDATRPRGHTSLSGAVEVQIAVKRGAPGEVIATVELAKDFVEGAEFYSRLERVEVGTDPDGDAVTSMVVIPAETATSKPPTRKLSDRQRLALDALTECSINVGEAAPANLGLPASTTVLPIVAWREELYVRGVIDRDGPNPRQDFKRLHNSLQARSLIGVSGDLVWKA